MEPINYSQELQEHYQLAQRVCALLKEENLHLRKHAGAPLSEQFLMRKRQIIQELDDSLHSLREMNRFRDGERLGMESRKLLKDARQLLMKVMLLDRENETLMLKHSLQERIDQNLVAKVDSQRVTDTYNQIEE